MLKDLRNLLNGAVYGTTLIIPGVSATILAVMLGFYDDLIGAMNHFREDLRKNARYLGVFVLGIAAGSVVFSSVVLYLLDRFHFPTMMFFSGLLTGIVPLVTTEAMGPSRKVAVREIVLTLFSFLALYTLSSIVNTATVDHTDAAEAMSVALVLYVFLAGIINGATLVIPGLSGAFLMLIMGLYPLIMHSISLIGVYIGNPGNFPLLWEICTVLLPYGVGAVIGCLCMARLMEKLMRDFHKAVYAVILGLVIGSVIILLQDHMAYVNVLSALVIITGAATFCAGCAAAYFLGKH
jgi:putative membrane protein